MNSNMNSNKIHVKNYINKNLVFDDSSVDVITENICKYIDKIYINEEYIRNYINKTYANNTTIHDTYRTLYGYKQNIFMKLNVLNLELKNLNKLNLDKTL